MAGDSISASLRSYKALCNAKDFLGYYGDALSLDKGNCRACECSPIGTIDSFSGPPICDRYTGQCACKPHVQGKNCDACEAGYFNISSGQVSGEVGKRSFAPYFSNNWSN